MTTTHHLSPNPLVALRALRPPTRLTPAQERRVAERQAATLLHLSAAGLPPYGLEIIGRLPRVRVIRDHRMPVSGSSHWTGSVWVIVLNATESEARQRFTAFHELHHVICQPFRHFLLDEAVTEKVADQFAACALMPRPMMRRCWRDHIRHPEALADLYEVSEPAMRRRLRDLRLGRRRPPSPRGGQP